MSRTCPECGATLEPDEQFCGSCGCYLEWTDQPAPEPEAVTVPPTEQAPAAPGLVGRVRSALGAGDDRPPAGAPAAPPAPPAPPAGAAAPGPRPSGSSPSGPPPSSPPVSTPAQSLVAPVDRPQQPRAQQPGTTAPRPRRQATAAPEPLQPGDLVCGSCGTGNKPARKFCRRCGETLAEATVARIPIWRRVVPQRKPRTTEAGTRPKAARTTGRRPRVPTRLLTVLGVLALLGVGGYAFRNTVLGGVDSVRDRVQDVERVVPAKVGASTAQEGHGAGLIKDGTLNKYWAPAEAGDGKGQYVEASFEEPIRLVYVLITPGVSSSDEEAYQQQGRPREIKVTATNDDGGAEVKTIELEDERGAAEVSLGFDDVVRVRFQVLRSYAGNVRGSRVAIAELEFWARK